MTDTKYKIVPVEASDEMIDVGAGEVNKQMRGPGAPADWHAAKDARIAEQSAEIHRLKLIQTNYKLRDPDFNHLARIAELEGALKDIRADAALWPQRAWVERDQVQRHIDTTLSLDTTTADSGEKT